MRPTISFITWPMVDILVYRLISSTSKACHYMQGGQAKSDVHEICTVSLVDYY